MEVGNSDFRKRAKEHAALTARMPVFQNQEPVPVKPLTGDWPLSRDARWLPVNFTFSGP